MWSDTFLIVFISICTAFLGEGIKNRELIGLEVFSVIIIHLFCQYCRAHLGASLPHRKIPAAED